MDLIDVCQVKKRNGELQDIAFDKILNRVKKICKEINIKLNVTALVIKVIDQLYDGIETTKIDELTCEQCASLVTSNYAYQKLANALIISNLHKTTSSNYYHIINELYYYKDVNGKHSPLINKKIFDLIILHHERYSSIIDYNRDYNLDYFGFKTLEKSYLLKINNRIVERPQHMWMRVSIALHEDNFDKVEETYYYLSQLYFTHATPTLFNAGTPRQQLSSCYLIAMEDDSIQGIYNTLSECALISKHSGGIGLHIHNIRANGSEIRGTNGSSNGIVPMLKVFNATARYCDQGGGKRNGSFAVYLEPWHSDIMDFLELRKNHGDEEMKARDLFYALWTPDLFMERVKNNGEWTLMCPDKCPGLSDVYGEQFNILYTKYETENKGNKTIKARELWFKILDSQMETGTPYILYKDACNKKSNQQNLGTIKSSNLCVEIVEYSDKNETAVCNLASIALNKFVNREKVLEYGITTLENLNECYDFNELHKVVKIVANNLDNIIDINYYPTPKTETSNKRHRPIGIGVQGLADTFALLNLPFYSENTETNTIIKTINQYIFETMYHAALEKSIELSIQKGPYITFDGSPTSNGILQFDLWNHTPSSRYNWDELKNRIKINKLRNSLLIAPMPTASTSQILGNNECFEPFTSNIYMRRTLAGEFIVANKYLMDDLTELGLWDDKIKNNIIANKGSIQHIPIIPEKIKEKYKIVWEMPMKHLIDLATARAPFICQSQSMNLWLEEPNYNSMTSMHFYSWNQGLKTGIYYLRRKGKHQAQQFTLEPETAIKTDDNQFQEENICEMCSG